MFVGNPYDAWTWTHDAVYDSETFQSTLTDITAAVYWEPGQMTGKFLNPDTTQPLQFYIVDNTDTTITVWGDVSEIAQARDYYEIYDYHLLQGSPCIDSGDSTIDAGDYDLDGNSRYVDALDTATWDGTIKSIIKDDDSSITIQWIISDEHPIDMGAYEYQTTHTVDTYTVQSTENLTSGTWQNIFTGNVGTWADTNTAGVKKRFYRVGAE